MFKTLIIFYRFFKSLILQMLQIRDFCDFRSYLVFGLYFGYTDSTTVLGGPEPLAADKKAA
jgi:hypothetical protein